MAKYEPLQSYLAARPEQMNRVTMSFDEIEALVGSLPPSARNHGAWWANDSKVQAQAWRTAGWRVESVDQRVGRVAFTRSIVGGPHPIARKPRPSPAIPAPQPIMVSTLSAEDGMPEARAQTLLVTYLVSEGWRIQRVADTTTKEQGIDVLATRGDRTLAVEVKGYPGRRYSDPRRVGETKPTAPATQARHWYAQAILKAMLMCSDHPGHEIAIALPDVPTYRSLYQRTRGSLQRIDVTIFFIDDDGRVEKG
jgi:Holliday junction resolvase-like predicted endonuclease